MPKCIFLLNLSNLNFIGATALSNIVMDQQTIRDGISGQQIILQQPSSGNGINNQHPTIVTTSGNFLSSSVAKRQRLNLGNQASELVETHHLVVAGDNEPVNLRLIYFCQNINILLIAT